jgi:hypothetical protein
MKFPRVRFRLWRLMIAVGVVAVALACWDSTCSWWTVKPFFNIVFIPVVSVVLALQEPKRRMILAAITLNAFFLLLWFELKRPLEGVVIGGEFPEHVEVIVSFVIHGDFPNFLDRIQYLVDWVTYYGTLLDLVSVVVPLLLLTILLFRPIPFHARMAAASSLSLLRIYGWATSNRSGGTAVFPWSTYDDIPVRLAQAWVRGEGTLSSHWARIGAVKTMELLVLLLVLASLMAVFVRAVLHRNGSVSTCQS